MFCWGCGALRESSWITGQGRSTTRGRNRFDGRLGPPPGWRYRLCPDCLAGLSPAPVRSIGGLTVWSTFLHRGAAKHLVHALKFGGVDRVASLMAVLMVDRVPPASCLVPIPRSVSRQVRYGVDAAGTLARALGRLGGHPVMAALDAPLLAPSHTGRTAARRPDPGFRLLRPLPEGSLLIDDVVTTGSTLMAAARISGARQAMTFTSALTK